jgi:hypothetical protein
MLITLIDNLIDKAYTKNKSSPSRLALYNQKDNNNNSKDSNKGKGKGNKGNKDRSPCKTYSILNVKHKLKDYLAVNHKKCKEWKEKNKKKWLHFNDFIK